MGIKLARIAKGMKQYELAAQLGIAPSRLCMWETGRVQPPKEMVLKAAEILGIKVENM